MFQKLTPSEQCQIVQHLGLKHLNEIHGLERMNKYPPDRLPLLIVPGEVVDLANSKNIIDKEFAARNLDSYNCMDYALRRMKGGVQAWPDKIGFGALTIVNSKDLQSMGISEVHGPPKVGDLVAINGPGITFLHAGVVESVSKDETITVIEKLGSLNQLPVIRQTLQDFSRTWDVDLLNIRIFRKQ